MQATINMEIYTWHPSQHDKIIDIGAVKNSIAFILHRYAIDLLTRVVKNLFLRLRDILRDEANFCVISLCKYF